MLNPGKGETSDSFKRAAVHWGINRDAYELGEITINCKVIDQKPVPCDESGNVLSGEKLLEECKRISSIQGHQLVFDKRLLPLNPAPVNHEIKPIKERKSRKPKTIMP